MNSLKISFNVSALKIVVLLFLLLGIQTLSIAAPPVNDNFANAIELTGVSGTTSGSNVDASAEVN